MFNFSTLEGILSVFHKVVAKLEAFIEAEETKASAKRAQVAQLLAEVNNHASDADKAKKVIANVKAIVS